MLRSAQRARSYDGFGEPGEAERCSQELAPPRLLPPGTARLSCSRQAAHRPPVGHAPR
jgi:hypothetical protein